MSPVLLLLAVTSIIDFAWKFLGEKALRLVS